MSWTKEEILRATGGKLLGDGKTLSFGEIVTDSRKVEKGSIFVALKGERLDGHAFLGEALRRGAACLLVHKAARRFTEVTMIKVPDTLRALGDLAHYRRSIVAPKVLAITGSNGKTTVKEMVASILDKASLNGMPLSGKVLKTEGNYNNLVGLPLTLLGLRGNERAAVLEMGTSRPGEIRRLTEIAAPDIGVITSVAPAHLEGLSSLRGVAREKGDLFRGLQEGGIAVVNLDDPWVRRLGERFKGRKITYGKKGEVSGDSWRPLGGRGAEFLLRVGDQSHRIRLGLLGEHNLSNALGAAAMAYGLGADLEAIGKGLEAVKPFPMRMALERWRGIQIINDTYNANPASMEAALKALAQINSRGKKIAVLGDMLELGKESRNCHLALGRQAARYRLDRLFLLGRLAAAVKVGALLAGMDEKQVTVARSHKEMARMIRREIRSGDWLLFKGSRGMKMEKVLSTFKGIGE